MTRKIEKLLPSVSVQSLEATFQTMSKEAYLPKHGSGGSTMYLGGWGGILTIYQRDLLT